VEDPFSPDDNTAGGVWKSMLVEIFREMERARDLCERGGSFQQLCSANGAHSANILAPDRRAQVMEGGFEVFKSREELELEQQNFSRGSTRLSTSRAQVPPIRPNLFVLDQAYPSSNFGSGVPSTVSSATSHMQMSTPAEVESAPRVTKAAQIRFKKRAGADESYRAWGT
jgi:hypothetical protein